jgi:hypothetical protein
MVHRQTRARSRGLALLVVALVAAPSVGAAAPRPSKARDRGAKAEKQTTLVLRLEAPRAFDATLVAKLDAAVRAQVAESSPGTKLLPPPALDLESMQVAAGCGSEGPGCLASIGEALGTREIIRAELSGTVAEAKLVLTIVRVKDQKARTAELELTAVDAGVVEELRWRVARALGDERPAPAGAIALAGADADHPDLELLLDDAKVPRSALASVAPGEHRLELRREGAGAQIWTGVVRPGRRVEVAVALVGAPSIEGLVRSETLNDAAEGSPLAEVEASATTDAPRRPGLLYTWALAGGAAVSTGLGIYFSVRQAGLESDLAAECDGATIEGRFVCQNPDYQSCAAFPDRDVCRSGRTTQTATYVLFPLAGALAVGAVAAFFLEDGPALWAGDASNAPGALGWSAGVVPLEGGALGAVRGSY